MLEMFEMLILQDYRKNLNRSNRRSSGQTLSERDNKTSQNNGKNKGQRCQTARIVVCTIILAVIVRRKIEINVSNAENSSILY